MKSMIKSKFKIIIPTMFIVLSALILISIFMSKNIWELSGMYSNEKNKNEQIPLFSYMVYDNQDSEAIKVLITVTSDSGIEYVETPDNKVYAGNKEKLSFDYLVKKDEGKVFKIKEVGKAEKEETLLITDESFKNTLKIESVAEYNSYRTINIVNNMSLDGYKTYYKIGNSGTWQEGSGTVTLIYHDLRKDCLLNSDDTVTISAYMKNDKSGDIINIPSEDFDVDTTYLTNFNIENRESCKADSSSGGNVEFNIVDGSYQYGNSFNWYGGTKCLITYNSLCDISSMAVYTTSIWGYSFSRATIYYSDDDSLTLDSDLSNFNSITINTESWQELNEVIHAKRVMLVKGFTNAVYEFECLGKWDYEYENGLVDYWPLNNSLENTIDSGTGNLQVVKGNQPTFTSDGVYLNNIVLSTQNYYVMPYKYSIVFQIKPTQITPWSWVLGKKVDSLQGYDPSGLWIRTSKTEPRATAGNGLYVSPGQEIYNVNEQSTIVITHDGGTMSLYANGNLVGTNKVKNYSNISHGKIYIGGSNYSGAYGGYAGGQLLEGYSSGYYKNVRIYNKALTLQEIQNLGF